MELYQVKAARKYNVPFLATGGRHGYGTTLSKLRNGLAIDMSHLNEVKIDQTSSTLTVEGGAKIRDVLRPVHDAGFQLRRSHQYHRRTKRCLMLIFFQHLVLVATLALLAQRWVPALGSSPAALA